MTTEKTSGEGLWNVRDCVAKHPDCDGGDCYECKYYPDNVPPAKTREGERGGCDTCIHNADDYNCNSCDDNFSQYVKVKPEPVGGDEFGDVYTIIKNAFFANYGRRISVEPFASDLRNRIQSLIQTARREGARQIVDKIKSAMSEKWEKTRCHLTLEEIDNLKGE